MNNISSTNRDEQLKTWAKIISDCKEAKASGVKVKDWLIANNISHDAYYYWYAEVKAAYVNNVLPEIVAVNDALLSPNVALPAKVQNSTSALAKPVTPIPTSCTSCIKISINGIDIEVNELTNPELLSNVIRAVRYA